MNAQDLMSKAQRALTSARTLLRDSDNDGACNRAYYGEQSDLFVAQVGSSFFGGRGL